jgi:ribonuclease HI
VKPDALKRALLALFLGEGSVKVAAMMGLTQREFEAALLGLVPVSRAPHAPAWPAAATAAGDPPITVHVDAGSRGNPGPSACAFVARRPRGAAGTVGNAAAADVRGEETVRGKFLGVTTNNEAEYHGLVEALKWLHDEKIAGARVLMDSLLVVNQVLGRWKVKEPRLRPFVDEARELMEKTAARLEAVPREENMSADAEVNRILDREKHRAASPQGSA